MCSSNIKKVWMLFGVNVSAVCYQQNNVSVALEEKVDPKSEERKVSCTCFSKILPLKHLFFHEDWLVETGETNAIWPSYQCLKYMISCHSGFSLWYLTYLRMLIGSACTREDFSCCFLIQYCVITSIIACT